MIEWIKDHPWACLGLFCLYFVIGLLTVALCQTMSGPEDRREHHNQQPTRGKQ